MFMVRQAMARTPVVGSLDRTANGADSVIVAIGDEQISASIERHSHDAVHARARGGASVTSKAESTACDSCDYAVCGADLSDAAIPCIADEQILSAIQRHRVWG